MSIGGGASSGNSQGQTQLDPQIKGDWQNVFDLAERTAGMQTPGQTVAPLNTQEQQAIASLNKAPLVGAGAIQQGINRADQVNGSVAPITAARVGTDGYSAHDMTAAQLAPTRDAQAAFVGQTPTVTAAQINPGAVGSVAAGSFPGADLSGYMDPYKKAVFDTSLDQLDTARKRAINQTTGDATAQGGEGAWNGSRAGVSDSLTNEAFLKQAAQLASTLNDQGFQTAAQLQQADADRALAAGTTNQSTKLAIAGQNAGFTQQAGMSDADKIMQAILQNGITGTDVSKFNAGQDLTRAATGAQFDQEAAKANQDAQNTKEQFNAGVNNNAMATNAGYAQDAAKTNQAADLTGRGLSLTAAQLLGQLGGQQQGQYVTGVNAALQGGQIQQQNDQAARDAAYNNDMTARNLPLQTIESAFGILPTTASGGTSVNHSSGKSGNVGF